MTDTRAPDTRTPDELVEQYFALARGIARKFATSRPRWADEFESDAGLVLLDAARRYDPAAGEFRGYLSRRIRFAMIDVYRRMCRAGRCGSFGGDCGAELLDTVPDASGPTERDLRDGFDAVLLKFPERDREVLDRRFFLGETFDEIGAAVGVTGSMIHHRLGLIAELAQAGAVA